VLSIDLRHLLTSSQTTVQVCDFHTRRRIRELHKGALYTVRPKGRKETTIERAERSGAGVLGSGRGNEPPPYQSAIYRERCKLLIGVRERPRPPRCISPYTLCVGVSA